MQLPTMDFRGNKFVNTDGTLTDVAQNFFDTLNHVLIKNIGQEGLVMPAQKSNDIDVIQNNTTQSATGNITYTCQFGTVIYDNESNKAKVALKNLDGTPIFKELVTA